MFDIYAFISGRIREERKLSGFTIEELAELAGLTPSFVGLIERGDRKLSVLTLDKLSLALKVLPCELMRKSGKLPGIWERRILSLFNSHPEKTRKLIFKLLDHIVKHMPAVK